MKSRKAEEIRMKMMNQRIRNYWLMLPWK